jgi:hypothetical protein
MPELWVKCRLLRRNGTGAGRVERNKPIISSYAERPTAVHSTGLPSTSLSHVPRTISTALVSAQGSNGYAGRQYRASAPPRVKNST